MGTSKFYRLAGLLFFLFFFEVVSAQTAFDGRVGLYLWGGNLGAAHGAGQPLRSSSKLIANSGFSAIRLAIGPESLYDMFTPAATKPANLSAWLDVAQTRDTLLDPSFSLVAITLHDHTSAGLPNNLSVQIARERAIYDEYFAFFTRLYALPVKKTFVITNWEGDNQMYCEKVLSSGVKLAAGGRYPAWIDACDAQMRASTPSQSLNDSIDGYLKWNLTRKAALLEARKSAGSTQVEIKFGLEFNSLRLINRAYARSVLWDLVPVVKPEVVLYSSYESVYPNTLVQDLKLVRTFLDGQGLRETAIGIGEIGLTGAVPAQRAALKNLLTEVARDFPSLAFAFVWNAFTPRPLAQLVDPADKMGFWQPDGNPYLAPTAGRLVPKLAQVSTVPAACFNGGATSCELGVSGEFPLYSLNQPTALLRCTSITGVVTRTDLKSTYVSPTRVTVTVPKFAEYQSCELQVRSDLGLPSAWSNSFTVESGIEGFDIVVVGGQSNSSNAGIGAYVDPLRGVADQKIFQLECLDYDGNKILNDFETSGYINAIDFTHDCQSSLASTRAEIAARGNFGFAVPFARQYAVNKLALNRRILIVAGGVGCTGSLEWLPGTPYLENLLSRARAALGMPGKNRVVAVLWSQGEADIFSIGSLLPGGILPAQVDHHITTYAFNLQSIIARARSVLGAPLLPFLMAEKAPEWTSYQDTKLRYQAADRWVATTMPRAAVVTTIGLASNPRCESVLTTGCEFAEHIHLSAQSNVYMGERFFRVLQQVAP